MAGYVRNDTANNIADGNIINAADLDGEFDAIQAAFVNTTGHTHDGTAAEGAPITKIGPTQDVVASISALTPKTDNTVDLGSAALEYKDLYIDGTANIDSLVADTADINGGTIDGVTIGGASAGAATFTTVAATTGNITTVNATTVNATTVDTTNIEVTTLKAKDGTSAGSIADSTGIVTLASSVLTTTDINGGTVDGASIGASSPSTGAFTTLSASSTTTLSSLTASTALALNASKEIVSVTNTGTGDNVLATSPTLITPNLGTPSTLVLTNATGLPTSALTGTVSAANGGTGLSSSGANGNVLTSNGTTWTSAALPAGGLTYVVKTANYTTQDKEGVLADTTGGAFTVTLPATPTTGAQVVVADSGGAWGTNNLTVGRNGSTIVGISQDLVCDISGTSVQFVYDGTTWEVYTQIGGNGGTAVTLSDAQTLTNKTMDYTQNTFTNFPASTPFSDNTSLAQVQAVALSF